MGNNKITIQISTDMINKLKSLAKNPELESADAYVEYILSQVISNLEKNETKSSDEEKKIKERLKSLGYVD